MGVICSFLRSRLLRCLRQWTSALRSLSCRWNSVQQPCDSSTSGQTFSLKGAPFQTWLHLRASHPQFTLSQPWDHQHSRGVWTARRSGTFERRSSERLASCSGGLSFHWRRSYRLRLGKKTVVWMFRILIRYDTLVGDDAFSSVDACDVFFVCVFFFIRHKRISPIILSDCNMFTNNHRVLRKMF